ncbi:hypothetical protein OGAPHI_002617 [Ogataea philodendri]|uniref:Uncharacterized protein n=1 Tax=Ogataea philodendri TaxID=1378263 RepID=A0A9P8PCP1_9ASCO|nr:uncharacterized protein OGAPHI_002617 [Ogataea philodendri]KAH3668862.1 hypothetical protein OGAPHI_002617 [Ogataea philodendri]
MPNDSLLSRLESPKKTPKPSGSPKKASQAKSAGEQYKILDYSVNIFSNTPGFQTLNLDDIYLESNFEDDEDEQNLEILEQCVEFLLNTKFDFLSKARLSSKTKAKLSALRASYPNVVTINQMYAILPNMETFVDSRVEKLALQGRLKLITHPQANVRYIIRTQDLKSLIKHHTNSDTISSRFVDLLRDIPNVEAIPASLLAENGLNARILIDSGFLTFSSKSEWFTLTLPNLGPFWRLVRSSNVAIYKAIKATKFEQILEDDLRLKYEVNQSNFVNLFNFLQLGKLVLSGLLWPTVEFTNEKALADDVLNEIIEQELQKLVGSLEVCRRLRNLHLDNDSLALDQISDKFRLLSRLVGDGNERQETFAFLENGVELLVVQNLVHLWNLVHENELQWQLGRLGGSGQRKEVVLVSDTVHVILGNNGPDEVVVLGACFLINLENQINNVLGRRRRVDEEAEKRFHDPHENVLSWLQLDFGSQRLDVESTCSVKRIVLCIVFSKQLGSGDTNLVELFL